MYPNYSLSFDVLFFPAPGSHIPLFFDTYYTRRMLINIHLPLFAALAAAASPYAPTSVKCPEGPFIRDGNTALGAGEAAYLTGRKPKADAALRTWLEAQSPGLGASSSMPTLAFSISGGGYRALLVGAGVMQGMDERDSNVSTSGLLQALSYHIGVSGGAWLVASWAGNNFPTISSLKHDLWLEAFYQGTNLPGGRNFVLNYARILKDVYEKDKAGYPTSLTDVWSRMLSYQMLAGEHGGVATRLSDVARYSNMTEFNAPIPIIDINGVNVPGGKCDPTENSTVWEANPFEFGSWDDSVSAWIPVAHLGTAANSTDCTLGFDNLGFVLGMSSNLFAYGGCVEDNPFSEIMGVLKNITEDWRDISERTMFGRVPNSFYGFTGGGHMAAEVFADDELYMVDGGLEYHNDPVAPLLEPARNVSAIFLVDASADTNNLPDGDGLVAARDYVQTVSRISTRLPRIPDKEIILAQGLTNRAVFFGCNESEAVTIVYLPNVNYIYESNLSTAQSQYDYDVTEGVIANGVMVATQNREEGWGLCLACAIMMKEEGVSLPDGCEACFDRWCYRHHPSNTT